ncbi:hypothetical protein PM035_16225 [Halorubrum ezzemoulense]|uniref:hypothetical protein n=1 Tax=Halorubrum ezzemoulense TaxID=337243 RepID=UPI00232BC98F|nr:hypothetical protein [Halorubrum ezzemoulense]MDB2262285.1 hypothetical protein [Halorubrum ezzemoulense]MDB2269194.1 hypothetical protein [Halorubrum ezzemoulense]
MFGTQVRLVDNALLKMILAPGLVVVSLVVADTTGGDVLVTVPVLVVDADSTIYCTDGTVTAATT